MKWLQIDQQRKDNCQETWRRTNRKDCEWEDFDKVDCQNVNLYGPIDLFKPYDLSPMIYESNDSDRDLILMEVTTGEAEKKWQL